MKKSQWHKCHCVLIDWKLILFLLRFYYLLYFKNYFIKLLGALVAWKNQITDEVVVDLA